MLENGVEGSSCRGADWFRGVDAARVDGVEIVGDVVVAAFIVFSGIVVIFSVADADGNIGASISAGTAAGLGPSSTRTVLRSLFAVLIPLYAHKNLI